MLIGRSWKEDGLLLVVPENLLSSAAFFNDGYYRKISYRIIKKNEETRRRRRWIDMGDPLLNQNHFKKQFILIPAGMFGFVFLHCLFINA